MLRISDFTFIMEVTKTHVIKVSGGERIAVIKGEIYKVRKITRYGADWFDLSGEYYEFTRYKPVEYDKDKDPIVKWFLLKWLWFRPFKKLSKEAVEVLFKG